MIQGLLGLSGGNNQMFGSTGFAPGRMQVLQELVRRHNTGQLDLPDEQVKQLAKAAASAGLKFNVESKPVRKALFDAADTITLGLIPNELRPRSIGEDIFGESLLDRTAGLAGSIGGGFGLGSLALRGGAMALPAINRFMNQGASAAARANANASGFMGNVRNRASNVMGTVGGLASSAMGTAGGMATNTMANIFGRYPNLQPFNVSGAVANPLMQRGGGLLSMPVFGGYRQSGPLFN